MRAAAVHASAAGADDVVIARVVSALRKRLLGLIPPGEELSIRASKRQLELLTEGLATGSGSLAFVASGGLAVVRSISLQRKLAPRAVELLLLLCKSRMPGIHAALLEEDMLGHAVRLCQSCSSSKLHAATVELVGCLALDAPHARCVVAAIDVLIYTQCRRCKETSLRCMSVISMDAASTRHLFLQAAAQLEALVPALTRIICDGRQASRKLRLEACQCLCWAAGQSASILQLAARLCLSLLMVLIAVRQGSDEARTFVANMSRWRVRDGEKEQAAAGELDATTRHSCARAGIFLAERLADCANSRVLDASRQHGLHIALLLVSFQANNADKHSRTEADTWADAAADEAEAAADSDVSAAASAALFAYSQADARIDAEVAAALEVRDPLATMHARLIAPAPAAALIDALRGQLSQALAADTRRPPPLLSAPNEGSRDPPGSADRTAGQGHPHLLGTGAGTGELGYRLLASLYAHDATSSVSDAQVDEVLARLAASRGAGEHPCPLRPRTKAAAVVVKGWEQPTGGRGRKKERGEGSGEAAPRPPDAPSSVSAARQSPRVVVVTVRNPSPPNQQQHQHQHRQQQGQHQHRQEGRADERLHQQEVFARPQLFRGIDLQALERVSRLTLFAAPALSSD